MTTSANALRAITRRLLVTAVFISTALGLSVNAHAVVIGDPLAAATFWQPQTYDNCGLMAVADVVGQITGDLPTEEEVISVASQLPSAAHPGSIYLPPANLDDPNTGQGTTFYDLAILLDYYRIDAVVTSSSAAAEDPSLPDSGFRALARYLADGHKVIVAVDADVIWGEDDDANQTDHVVVVTGIDTTEDILYFNDSGTDQGRQDQVTIETFAEAWSVSEESMLIALAT